MRSVDPLSAAERYVARRDVQLDPHVQSTGRGVHIVHGQQQYRGLSLYPHSIVIEVDARGEVTSTGDAILRGIELDVVPRLGPEDAASNAWLHLRAGADERCHTAHDPLFESGRYRARVVSAFPMTNRPTVLSAGPFDAPVQANLVVFRGEALAWLVTLVVKQVADFTIAVDATSGEVLYCAAEAASALCTATVFLFNPDEPPPVQVALPRPPDDYPPGLRPSQPFSDWCDGDEAAGNNVRMKLGNRKPSLRATTGRFVTAPNSPEERVLHAFFYCNFMHDFFSLIGFGEAEGNFQQKNFSGLGKAGDRLIVNVVSAAQGNANMRAQNDGIPAELTLGVWKNGNPTALDAEVVIHEFVHGVSQRLVAGRLKKTALVEKQSLALGEAWSDYFAITILNYYRAVPRYTFARFASGQPLGARPMPYDNFSAAFGDLGTAPFDEQHGAGSIFAAALIDMHERLRVHFGDGAASATGAETSWRLVVDSMKMLKANPTFLDARDAILRATSDAAVARVVRAAFAAFGMGRGARCRDTSFRQIQPDFSV